MNFTAETPRDPSSAGDDRERGPRAQAASSVARLARTAALALWRHPGLLLALYALQLLCATAGAIAAVIPLHGAIASHPYPDALWWAAAAELEPDRLRWATTGALLALAGYALVVSPLLCAAGLERLRGNPAGRSIGRHTARLALVELLALLSGLGLLGCWALIAPQLQRWAQTLADERAQLAVQLALATLVLVLFCASRALFLLARALTVVDGCWAPSALLEGLRVGHARPRLTLAGWLLPALLELTLAIAAIALTTGAPAPTTLSLVALQLLALGRIAATVWGWAIALELVTARSRRSAPDRRTPGSARAAPGG